MSHLSLKALLSSAGYSFAVAAVAQRRRRPSAGPFGAAAVVAALTAAGAGAAEVAAAAPAAGPGVALVAVAAARTAAAAG